MRCHLLRQKKMLEMPEEEQNKLLEETTGEKIEVKEVEKRIEEIEKKKVISKQQVESDLKKDFGTMLTGS